MPQPTRCLRLILLCIAAASCSSGQHAPSNVARSSAGTTALARPQTPPSQLSAKETPSDTPEFSGIIVRRSTRYDVEQPDTPLSQEEQLYFVQKNRWMVAYPNGITKVIYDPDTRNVHFFTPNHGVVDSTEADGMHDFRFLSKVRTILGYACKGIEHRHPMGASTSFVCPDIWVAPSHYVEHRFGGWGKMLQFTQGALPLFEQFRTDKYRVVTEAIRIERRSFESQFWEKAFWDATRQ